MSLKKIPSLLCLCLLFTFAVVSANDLSDTLGRREYRVYSAPYPLSKGLSIRDMDLPQRLFQLDYQKLTQKPTSPGAWFQDDHTLWIYRRAYRVGGQKYKAFLFGLTFDRDQIVTGAVAESGNAVDMNKLALEPAVLAESLDGRRAKRVPVAINEIPEDVWRALLAAEDHRFFEHLGLDPKALARSTVANIKAGKVVQGGSTITQQLVKNRDMTPKRSFARKASEALRAIRIEASHDKMDILETYMNTVYLGHVSGVAVYGYGAAAKAYFSKDVKYLKLDEAALLAAMIQGPNRLDPEKHPHEAKERRDWVIARMEELDWVDSDIAWRFVQKPITLNTSKLERTANVQMLDWVSDIIRENRPRRLKKKKGVVVETTIDPYLQKRAEDYVGTHLARYKSAYRSLSEVDLQAALISMDAETGEILAYVAANPAMPGDYFDRIRNGKRQIGSLVKPFIVLEAFEGRGDREPLHPATRISDKRLVMHLDSGKWRPQNHDRKYHGIVNIRQALSKSYNVPFVRLGGYLGYDNVAAGLNKHGLTTPNADNPSFLLGTQEIAPLDMARSWSTLANRGVQIEPYLVKRLEKPKGRKLEVFKSKNKRMADPSDVYLIDQLLQNAVKKGTGKNALLRGITVAGKTGSSSGLRDAWFAGRGGGIITIVWVGKDEGKLGLTGSAAAAPIWRDYMREAANSRPHTEPAPPGNITTEWVDLNTGMIVSRKTKRGYQELFRKDNRPKRDRWWHLPGKEENIIR